ncbi:pectin utilization transcriptional regulator KdgR [Gibbsiella dentisursi]|uniref:Pectin utilization transcriptional regulator KdgR n=1 Tax=Gibbsiella dentisursi TaxID=796890 RepID=A0ABP7KQG8_9GAMM
MKSKLAIRDIAQMVGVSTATISRYLNGKYHSMSNETRLRIEKTIAQMGYQPNNVARSLRSTQSKTIAVIMADIFNPYSMDVLKGIEEICSSCGYTIFICDARDSGERERILIEEMTAKCVDGFIINTTGENNDYIMGLSLEYPVVLVGRKIQNTRINSVSVDNLRGITLAMEHLCSKGCTAITFLSPTPGNISPRLERIKAFTTLAQQAEFATIDCRLELLTQIDDAAVAHIIHQLGTQRTARPALITSNGKLSLHTVKAFKALNRRVPEDILMVGFDDTDWAQILRNPLTVIAQPTYEIGQAAANKLIPMLTKEKGLKETTDTVLPPTLIEREST